ncbi:DUF2807 domain-containing protein [Erythrobacter sp. GH3-10]|uniref:DUF2807 domain-containing protein n=1 Tax=Aurantiacibacter rhizosphaerae TaxID=2691582 RepID=A0A844X927_9SPHN|nr:DUF2807 domain-containing protein [Aurantiacibacter rhizosphaerae]
MLGGCDNLDVDIDTDGVPLAELDMSGGAPSGVVLAGSDTVMITTGDEFDIDVEGTSGARDRMRFSFKDDALVIHRENGDWSSDDGTATVNITMPAPETLVMAGSGTMNTDGMAEKAEIVIAGSGTVTAASIAATKMEVTVGGSGTLSASGTTRDLELNMAGSGKADMAGLQVDDAEVTIAGSGNAEFASDGKVHANLAGSGTVRVRGSATCERKSIGSGELICEDG